MSSFVDNANNLFAEDKIDTALDLIYDSVNDLQMAGKWDQLDSIINNIDVSSTSSSILLGLLCTCQCSMSKLPSIRKYALAAIAVMEARPDFDKRSLVHIKKRYERGEDHWPLKEILGQNEGEKYENTKDEFTK